MLRAAIVRSASRSPLSTSGGARLDQHVAQRGGLDRPGDDRQAGRVGGELAQQGVLRAAADEVHRPHVAAGELGGRAGSRGGTRRASESRMQRTTSARDDGDGLPGRPRGPCDAGRHVARVQELAGVDVDHGAQRRDVGREASRSGRSTSTPSASRQVRIDSCSTHRPMTLRR